MAIAGGSVDRKEDGALIGQGMTAVLARYLGVHSVTVSKIMLSLKKMGIIEKEGHKIIIRDPEKLEDLAEHSGEFACEEL